MHQLGAGGGGGGEGKERHGHGSQQQEQQRRSSMAVSGGGGGEQSLERSTSDVVGPVAEGDQEVEAAVAAQAPELLPLHEALALLMAPRQSRTRAATEEGVVQQGSRGHRGSDPAGGAGAGHVSCSGGSGNGRRSDAGLQGEQRAHQEVMSAVPPPVIEEVRSLTWSHGGHGTARCVSGDESGGCS